MQLARVPTNDDGEPELDEETEDTDTSSESEEEEEDEETEDGSDTLSEDEIDELYATQVGDESDEEIDRRGPMPSIGDVIKFQLYDPYEADADNDFDETIPVDFGEPGPSLPTTPSPHEEAQWQRNSGLTARRCISTYGDTVNRDPESGTEYIVCSITNEVPNGKGQIVSDRIANRGTEDTYPNNTSKHFLRVVPLRDPTASIWNVRWFIDWDHFTICQHEDGAPIEEITSVEILEPPPIEEEMNDEYDLYRKELQEASEKANNISTSYGYGADLNFNDGDLQNR